jgi:hypothetical protein
VIHEKRMLLSSSCLVGSDNDCMVPRLLSRADKSISSSSAQEDISYDIVLVAWTEKKELDCV